MDNQQGTEINIDKPQLNFWMVVGHLKELIPIIALVVALIVGWVNLNNELGNIKETQAQQQAQILIIQSDQSKFQDTLNRVNENLAGINTALEFIKEKVK